MHGKERFHILQHLVHTLAAASTSTISTVYPNCNPLTLLILMFINNVWQHLLRKVIYFILSHSWTFYLQQHVYEVTLISLYYSTIKNVYSGGWQNPRIINKRTWVWTCVVIHKLWKWESAAWVGPKSRYAWLAICATAQEIFSQNLQILHSTLPYSNVCDSLHTVGCIYKVKLIIDYRNFFFK